MSQRLQGSKWWFCRRDCKCWKGQRPEKATVNAPRRPVNAPKSSSRRFKQLAVELWRTLYFNKVNFGLIRSGTWMVDLSPQNTKKYVQFLYPMKPKPTPGRWACTLFEPGKCMPGQTLIPGYTCRTYYPGQKKKNHPCDASCDIEESAVWFRRDASMREVAAVASRIRSRFRSWIKHLDSSISQDSDFMHQQDGSFFLSRVVPNRPTVKSCLEEHLAEEHARLEFSG